MKIELVKTELLALGEAVAQWEELICTLSRADLEVPNIDLEIVVATTGERLGKIAWGECGSPCFIVDTEKE